MARFKVAGRGLSTPRLKRRFQILVVITIGFMVAVSLLILQPDVFSSSSRAGSISVAQGSQAEAGQVQTSVQEDGHSDNQVQGQEHKGGRQFTLPPALAKLESGDALVQLPLRELIVQLVKKYRVDFDAKPQPGSSVWETAAGWVTSRQILPETAPELGAILKEMATAPIIKVDTGFKGTQLKLAMKLSGGQIVAFKPKWYEREHIVEGQPYAGRDRHNGEIAAFHLSRILEFRKTPIAVGRTISMHRELIPVSSQNLLKTFTEQDGEMCFYGQCHYCNKENSLCLKDDHLEGTVILWLPPSIHLELHRNPWRRTYREKLLAKWETDQSYCSIVQMIEPFKNNSGLLLDLIDTSIFDYLISNADRHHFENLRGVKHSMLVMLDNGKSFGNPYNDEQSILAPLYQCCRIRFSTWRRLLLFQQNVLGTVLREVLQADPISPVITQQHLEAINRRVEKVLHVIEKCYEDNGLESVILD